jgi:hypothetical protein
VVPCDLKPSKIIVLNIAIICRIINYIWMSRDMHVRAENIRRSVAEMVHHTVFEELYLPMAVHNKLKSLHVPQLLGGMWRLEWYSYQF